MSKCRRCWAWGLGVGVGGAALVLGIVYVVLAPGGWAGQRGERLYTGVMEAGERPRVLIVERVDLRAKEAPMYPPGDGRGNSAIVCVYADGLAAEGGRVRLLAYDELGPGTTGSCVDVAYDRSRGRGMLVLVKQESSTLDIRLYPLVLDADAGESAPAERSGRVPLRSGDYVPEEEGTARDGGGSLAGPDGAGGAGRGVIRWPEEMQEFGVYPLALEVENRASWPAGVEAQSRVRLPIPELLSGGRLQECRLTAQGDDALWLLLTFRQDDRTVLLRFDGASGEWSRVELPGSGRGR